MIALRYKTNSFFVSLIVGAGLLFSGCGELPELKESDTGSDAGTGRDTAVETDTPTAGDTGTGGETDTTGTTETAGTESATDTASDAALPTDVGTDTNTDTVPQKETPTSTETATATDTETDSDTGPETGSDTGGTASTDTSGKTTDTAAISDTGTLTDTTQVTDDETDSTTPTDLDGGIEDDTVSDLDAGGGTDTQSAEDTDTGTAERDTVIEWVLIDGGTFEMGNEDDSTNINDPEHPVHVPSFEIMKTEVSVLQFKECVNAEACSDDYFSEYESEMSYPHCNLGRLWYGHHPMNCVNLQAAREYCAFKEARLPTEAEWEFAARSRGRDRLYPWGDEEPTCELTVFQEISSVEEAGCSMNDAWPICSKPLGNTEQGLCDMAGNVWEWVEDDWHDGYTDAPDDGSAWTTDEIYTVKRGGAWDDSWDRNLATTYRNGANRDQLLYENGIRCARSLP
jgi:formylglycine-generating enzyme required for sulfatase activity